jgi:nicotinate-nucleotide adenylyltransferase
MNRRGAGDADISEGNERERVGVYGGTFDPPHLGHLILAETAAESLKLARVVFVPAGIPPHKNKADVREPAEHRLIMVERAIADNPRFALSRVDVDRAGPHYSVDMLRLLRDEYPAPEFVFLIGADTLRDLVKWSRPQELIQLARLGVMRRPDAEPNLDALERDIPGISARIEWIAAPRVEIASHVLADRIADGCSVRYQVPDAVLAYIRQLGLYRK